MMRDHLEAHQEAMRDLFSVMAMPRCETTNQMTLADITARPAARRTDPDTSHLAAHNTRATAQTNRAIALDTLRRFPRGLTDFELAEITGIQQTSIGKRRGELRDAGLVRDSGERRPSPTGSPSIVWEAV